MASVDNFGEMEELNECNQKEREKPNKLLWTLLTSMRLLGGSAGGGGGGWTGEVKGWRITTAQYIQETLQSVCYTAQSVSGKLLLQTQIILMGETGILSDSMFQKIYFKWITLKLIKQICSRSVGKSK